MHKLLVICVTNVCGKVIITQTLQILCDAEDGIMDVSINYANLYYVLPNIGLDENYYYHRGKIRSEISYLNLIIVRYLNENRLRRLYKV